MQEPEDTSSAVAIETEENVEGLSAIGAVSQYSAAPSVQYAAAAGTAESLSGSQASAASALAVGQSSTSIAASSMTATSTQTLIAGSSAAATDNQMLGAILLMLILEYLQSSDETRKQDALTAIVTMLQQLQEQRPAETFLYSSSSMSIESSQLQIASTDLAMGSYMQTAQAPQEVGASPSAVSGIDVLA